MQVEQYQELAFEVGRIQVKVVVVPLVIGTVLKDFVKWHEYLGIPDITGKAEMMALLGTSHILRKVLRLWAAGRS